MAEQTSVAAASAAPSIDRRVRLRWADLGALPLAFMLPFMYYPKVLDGDTQPWLLLAGLVALLTFRPSRFALRSDALPVLLAAACAVTYMLRSDSWSDIVRACYIQFAFFVFWLVCRRERDEIFPAAVRWTIVVWLAVGLYQYLALALGWPVSIPGRYVEGRSGVPSLTSEPSAYGSLSVMQMMYLQSRNERRNAPYIAAAAISTVLSGSVLALLLMVFPLVKLRPRYRWIVLALLPALVIADFLFTSAGLTSRLLSISAEGVGLSSLLLDPSLNLRAGHLYFTLWVNLLDSLTLQSPLAFMVQYNAFAQASGVFIETGSEFVLSAAGEQIYGAGPFGLLLLLTVLYRAQARSSRPGAKIEKVLFITVCMLNPFTLANFFLVLYANRRT